MGRFTACAISVVIVLALGAGSGAGAAQDQGGNDGAAWLALNTAFHNLGTEESRMLYTIYWDIVADPEAAVLKSFWVTLPDGTQDWIEPPAELAQMSIDDRKAWADQWLAGQPNGQVLLDHYSSERAAFKQAHPEYLDYHAYLAALKGYPAGLAQFRIDQRELSRAFAVALSGERWWLQSHGLTGSALEAALDAWTATGEVFLILIEEAR